MELPKEYPRTLVLTDIDGTLTKSRLPITTDMKEFLKELNKKVYIALVGGSDLAKIAEQMVPDSRNKDTEQLIENLIRSYDYVFAENGLVAYHGQELIGKQNILDKLTERQIQTFINFVLAYFSQLTLPVKRGNFIELRNGLINISPIGRSCSQTEREQFFEYDQKHNVRERMVQVLRQQFDGTDIEMDFSIGGQISIDCFPKGWDKRFCLQFIRNKFDRIYFFGDKTFPGGNDYEIFQDPLTTSYSVQSPEQTKQILTDLFFQ